ncbi:MAG: hypothetical protein CR982_05585 [Candidatus Cloacimonadota bacterium]|nr:MAG: hypothetical protein CR982_05585 [Candidatus Cloacimonadota bacterium]PIE81406.1 MAG: hypothetical protein CSA15_00785 [Candidatus Delongbacteria bacterium]
MRYFIIIFLLSTILRSELSDSVIAPSLSFIIPGGGQFYNKQYIRGSIYSGIELAFFYGIYYSVDKVNYYRDQKSNLSHEDPLYQEKKQFYKRRIKRYRRERNNYTWLTVATVLLSAGDAFVTTKFKEFYKRAGDGKGIDIKTSYNGIALIYNFN